MAGVMGRRFEFGSPNGLELVGEWNAEEPDGGAADRSRGRLSVRVCSAPAWGGGGNGPEGGIEWTWIELLESLAEAWPHLLWRETYPEPLSPSSPMKLEMELDGLGERAIQTEFEVVAEEVDSFLERHDLARMLGGLWARPLRILRQGRMAVVATPRGDHWLPAEDVFGALEEFGEAIAARIEGGTDDRSRAALDEWRRRSERSRDDCARIYVGLSAAEIGELGMLSASMGGRTGDFEPDECLATARMVGRALQPAALNRLVGEIATLKRGGKPRLDVLAQKAQGLNPGSQLPFQQGLDLAAQMRAGLPGGSVRDPLAIDQVLGALGVDVKRYSLPTDRLDAVAVWGPRRGPAVFVNPSGLHARSPEGLRATLAHELCHLLVDRGNALPLAEALGGRAPRAVEARANAFAAELLLPRSVVEEEAPRRVRVGEWNALFKRFGVSRQLGAWQVLNSGPVLSPSVRESLDRCAGVWRTGWCA